MKQIKVNSGLSSGVSSVYDGLIFIDIDDTPFAEGGFGKVYHCLSLNGVKPNHNLIVKIFTDNGRGSALQNHKTTKRLLLKIDEENTNRLSSTGKSLIETCPALIGVPKFSFDGNMNGERVLGFVSENLTHLGYVDFDHVLSDSAILSRYQSMPMELKLKMALQLVDSFVVLEKFNYLHADLKPGALFVNLDCADLAIIDYDSGVITEQVDDEPITWGAANDWVAPEIWQQQATVQIGKMIRVDKYSDRWSVAIGIHYLITTFHPLFFLKELSPRVARQYFAGAYEWPKVNITAPYFEQANKSFYDLYIQWVSASMPAPIMECMRMTISHGYTNTVNRKSYSDWRAALGASQYPPKIKIFEADKVAILDRMDVQLNWDVDSAHTVTIDGIGEVPKTGTITVSPRTDVVYILTANGHFGSVTSSISVRVFPTPLLESLLVPAPDYTSQVITRNPNRSGLSIDLKVQLHQSVLKDLKFMEIPPSILNTNPKYVSGKYTTSISEVLDGIKRRIQSR